MTNPVENHRLSRTEGQRVERSRRVGVLTELCARAAAAGLRHSRGPDSKSWLRRKTSRQQKCATHLLGMVGSLSSHPTGAKTAKERASNEVDYGVEAVPNDAARRFWRTCPIPGVLEFLTRCASAADCEACDGLHLLFCYP